MLRCEYVHHCPNCGAKVVGGELLVSTALVISEGGGSYLRADVSELPTVTHNCAATKKSDDDFVLNRLLLRGNGYDGPIEAEKPAHGPH